MSTDSTKLDYPGDAAQVRDLIRDMLKSQVDEGSSMDTGGGMGQADLWASFGGQEFIVTVRAAKPAQSTAAGQARSYRDVN